MYGTHATFFFCPLQHVLYFFLPRVAAPRYLRPRGSIDRDDQAPPSNYRVSALQAFWPAVQAAAGDEATAKHTYDVLFGLWEEYGALPDFFDPLNDRWVLLPQQEEEAA